MNGNELDARALLVIEVNVHGVKAMLLIRKAVNLSKVTRSIIGDVGSTEGRQIGVAASPLGTGI
jgi:hypothetical protein